MVDLFSPLTPDAAANRAAYQSFLTARDGVVDVERRTLTRREEGMARYTRPLSRLRELDRALFDAQYASFDPKVEMPPEMMLLMALVKVNAAESFGAIGRTTRSSVDALKHNDALELTLVIEETYHTRILLSSAVLYGIEVTSPFKPPATLRALISGITLSPHFISRPLTLASECSARCVFTNLLEKARDVLKHDPELRDSVEERLSDVLVDELGHVSFNRMCLGGAGLAQARMMLPMLGTTLGSVSPSSRSSASCRRYSEGEMLTCSTGERLPEHVRKPPFCHDPSAMPETDSMILASRSRSRPLWWPWP